MPAHLESTDRAMKAEKARLRKDAQARRMGDKDLEGSPEDQEVTSAAAPGASQKNRWRARVNAAVVLKKQGEPKSLEIHDENAKRTGRAARE